MSGRLIDWDAPCPVCGVECSWWSYKGDPGQAPPTAMCPTCDPDAAVPVAPPETAPVVPAAVLTLRAVARRMGAWL